MATEDKKYSLDEEIPLHVIDQLHAWVSGFIGLSPSAANDRLQERWGSAAHPALQGLAHVLQSFDVKAISTSKNSGMIYAVRPDSNEELVGNTFYLPGALGHPLIESNLRPFGLEGCDVLAEFIYYYGGLAEDAHNSGHFVYDCTPWPMFTDAVVGEIENYEDWKYSLMLFHARNGCFVLVRADGHIGWWIFQERRVEYLCGDFATFVDRFKEHRKITWPFDPYGCPESRR